jgi:hypothetical protein
MQMTAQLQDDQLAQEKELAKELLLSTDHLIEGPFPWFSHTLQVTRRVYVENACLRLTGPAMDEKF